MVLFNDVDSLDPADNPKAGMFHAATANKTDATAQCYDIHQYSVPVPIAVVRSHLRHYEDDCVERLLTRVAGRDIVGGWIQGPQSNGIQVVHGEVKGSAWHSLLTTATLDVASEQAARVLLCADMVPQYDDMTRDVRVVETLSDATQVRLVSCKPVLITSPRDFCVTTTVRRDANGQIVIATRSVDHPAGGLARPGFVRALSHISGYVVTPDASDPNMCELALIAHMDLGGNMPAFVVRYLGLSAPIKMVEKIRQVVAEAATAPAARHS